MTEPHLQVLEGGLHLQLVEGGEVDPASEEGDEGCDEDDDEEHGPLGVHLGGEPDHGQGGHEAGADAGCHRYDAHGSSSWKVKDQTYF